MKITHNPDPGPLRAAEYPSIGDQLDALWKAIDAIHAGKEVPPEAIGMLNKIKAVKAKYRKPT